MGKTLNPSWEERWAGHNYYIILHLYYWQIYVIYWSLYYWHVKTVILNWVFEQQKHNNSSMLSRGEYVITRAYH